MKKYIPFLACSIFIVATISVTAQEKKKYPQPAPMTPAMTEFWEPQPAIITPGDQDVMIAPPSDAVILFNGKDLSKWQHGDGSNAKWDIKNGTFVAKGGAGDIKTKQNFKDVQLHVEWLIPVGVEGESQGRGNSGVFMQGLYEVQILDCYNNESYINGQAASIYKQHPPLVNAMQKQGKWNTYDIIYTAPRFKKDGSLESHARVTVLHNGVLVQNNALILGPTSYVGLPKYTAHGDGPITLQDHGNPVTFRNIWVREL